MSSTRKKSKSDRQAVDAYLATLPKAEREILERLRALIKATIPRVEERVSYGTTVMFSLGRDLVGFVSQPKHLSFFTASPKLAHGGLASHPHQDVLAIDSRSYRSRWRRSSGLPDGGPRGIVKLTTTTATLGIVSTPKSSGRCHGVPRNERARA